MTDFFLRRGGLVLVDPDDLDLLEAHAGQWRLWRHRSTAPWWVVRDESSLGHQFRVALHRLVAARMEPRMQDDPMRFRVRAINRDFTDVRRENLAVTYAPPGSGRRPANRKPRGYRPYATTNRQAVTATNPLWMGGVEYRRDERRQHKGTDLGNRIRPYAPALGVFLDGAEAPRGHEPGGDSVD